MAVHLHLDIEGFQVAAGVAEGDAASTARKMRGRGRRLQQGRKRRMGKAPSAGAKSLAAPIVLLPRLMCVAWELS